jgi:hypothetical protein
MRYLFALLVYIAFTASCASSPVTSSYPAGMQVMNLAPNFVTFLDRTNGQPIDARVAEFKRELGPRFPSFYGIARYGGERTQTEQDSVIRRAIEDFPAIRERYIEKTARFGTIMPKALTSFAQRFPDFSPNIPVYVLHSLGEADGGVRSLPDGDALFFGIDSMVRLHGDNDETPFFHHELFHTYHTPELKECAGGPMWAYLWVEGLATYVSKALNPQASDAELLLDIPVGVAARYRETLADSLAEFERVVDSTDRAVYRDLFTRASTSRLPARRGYYLGYVVAAEASPTYSLSALASLNCSQARELVLATVRSLHQKPTFDIAQ